MASSSLSSSFKGSFTIRVHISFGTPSLYNAYSFKWLHHTLWSFQSWQYAYWLIPGFILKRVSLTHTVKPFLSICYSMWSSFGLLYVGFRGTCHVLKQLVFISLLKHRLRFENASDGCTGRHKINKHTYALGKIWQHKLGPTEKDVLSECSETYLWLHNLIYR